MEILESVTLRAGSILREGVPPQVLLDIASDVHQPESKQTTDMAIAILLNAVVFHFSIEGHPDIPMGDRIRKQKFSKSSVLESWEQILQVNYWAIFAIANRILQRIPARTVPDFFNVLVSGAEKLVSLGASSFHDLSGRMFQKLISDRKFLASFYTLPTAAQLLAELSVSRLNIDWSDPRAILSLRVADFACGTGALLAAVQRDCYIRYRREGGDDIDIHQKMIEQCLIGTDIMPAATHVTASMLASPHPSCIHKDSGIHTLAWGREEDDVYLGALELLENIYAPSLFSPDAVQMSGVPKKMGGGGGGGFFLVPNESLDLVIMNPPYASPTVNQSQDTPVLPFAGMGNDPLTQREMSQKLKRIYSRLGRNSDTAGHGNAGVGANFIDIAHRKLKEEGVLALVLPLTFVNGDSWKDARRLLNRHYNNVRVVAIAGANKHPTRFSADTNMGECLFVGTKHTLKGGGAVFSTIPTLPSNFVQATQCVSEIKKDKNFTESLNDARPLGVLDKAIVFTVAGLCEGRLQWSRIDGTIPLHTASLGDIASLGKGARDIAGRKEDKGRSPFTKRDILDGEVPTFPMLWNHDHTREHYLIVEPDSCGDVREGKLDKAREVWKTSASHLHSNINFRMTSQSLAMCRTPMICIGGDGWPSVFPNVPAHEKSLLLWSNSTLGLIMFWYHGTRQQLGRARISNKRLLTLSVLDTRRLSEQQMESFNVLYEEASELFFLPANEAYRDDNRKLIDTEIFRILKIPEKHLDGLDLLREKWCCEPSVSGTKSTRPSDKRCCRCDNMLSENEKDGIVKKYKKRNVLMGEKYFPQEIADIPVHLWVCAKCNRIR